MTRLGYGSGPGRGRDRRTAPPSAALWWI